ncbi:cyclin n-terminal domain-containing protein 1-like [Plakobranchus ocellatus]|uniref:Cyclin n-terminal domain-containing protein 1-like n=1 Tax=Plakobranchus ocellatus TaxID=259542 RepID=A0AAV4A5S7_9GAST|nr:cyclin n-terminal domain-containing protein 1-like [Plakobranchus ocellatus]
MGAVDRSNQMVAYNAFKHWGFSAKKMSQQIFRRELAKQLVQQLIPTALSPPLRLPKGTGHSSLFCLTACHFPQTIKAKPGAKRQNPKGHCAVCLQPSKRKQPHMECPSFEVGYNAGKGVLDVKVYHDTAIKILMLVCLNRHQVYDRLYLNTAGICAGVLVSSQEQKSQLAAVTCDMMLLSVAVVAVAVHINDDSLTQQIILQLHKISEVPIEDIQDFCKVILMSLHDFVDQKSQD